MGQTMILLRSASMPGPGEAAPSAAALMPLFAPYCGGFTPALERALERLLLGHFEGCRPLRGGEGHPYVLRWSGGLAPLDDTPCELQFPQLAAVHYRFQLPAHRLLLWLAQSDGAALPGDLPEGFWRWLILGDDSGA